MDWVVIWTAIGALGATIGPFGVFALQARIRNKGESPFTIADSDWLVAHGLSYKALLHRLIYNIDYLALAGSSLSELSEGTVQQWAPIFEKSPETWAMVVCDDRLIVGYWSFFSLSDELVGSLKERCLFDSEITETGIRCISEAGPHTVYFPMVAYHPDFQHAKHTIIRLLMQSLAKTLGQLVDENVQISEIYADCFSREGESMCRNFGMQEIGETLQNGKLYSGELNDKVMRKLAKFRAS